MSGLLLGIVTSIYAVQTGICFWQGQLGQAIILFGYTIANVGLIMVVVK